MNTLTKVPTPANSSPAYTPVLAPATFGELVQFAQMAAKSQLVPKEYQNKPAAIIYTAVNDNAAGEALEDFAEGPWGRKYPAIAPAWRRQWEQIIPFFAYPPEVRRIIYTTNAIESLNSVDFR